MGTYNTIAYKVGNIAHKRELNGIFLFGKQNFKTFYVNLKNSVAQYQHEKNSAKKGGLNLNVIFIAILKMINIYVVLKSEAVLFVKDLNQEPEFEASNRSFDVVICIMSVQYLQ